MSMPSPTPVCMPFVRSDFRRRMTTSGGMSLLHGLFKRSGSLSFPLRAEGGSRPFVVVLCPSFSCKYTKRGVFTLDEFATILMCLQEEHFDGFANSHFANIVRTSRNRKACHVRKNALHVCKRKPQTTCFCFVLANKGEHANIVR